eukprot:gene39215-47718_t
MGPRKKKAVTKIAEKNVEAEKVIDNLDHTQDAREVEKSTTSASPTTLPSENLTLDAPLNKENTTLGFAADSLFSGGLDEEQVAALSGDLDEDEEEEFKPKLATGSADDLKSRLFQLRMKINQGRRANQQEVEEEFQRVALNRRRDRIKEDAEDEQESLLDQTAAEAEWEAMKAEKKKETAATYGLNAFTSDAYYRAYEKRVSKLQHDKRVEASKQDEDEDENFNYDPLSYGKTNSNVTADALDRLQKDVLDREEQRKKYSRKRPELGDVDYINEKNHNFNKKLKRAFDKYTVEIRQNLERGTAI